MKKSILILSLSFFALSLYAQKPPLKTYKQPYTIKAKDTSKPKKNSTNIYNPSIYKSKTNFTLMLDSSIKFFPTTVGPYCPTKLLAGDREFGGHGPEINADITLTIENGNQLFATVNMHARETESDWSETEGSWKKLIYTAPSGFNISQIQSGKHSEVHYISKPGLGIFSKGAAQELFSGAKGNDVAFNDDGLVTRWNIVGDTMGDDISTDRNCKDDTQVAVQLNPIKLLLRRK